MRKLRKSPKVIALALAAVVVTVVAAAGSPASAAKSTEPVTLRLGYFPNVTHAAAIVGMEGGIFAKKLGSGVDLKLKTFNTGTEALAAFQAGALDASYIGPNPTITAWTQFDKSVKVISGCGVGWRVLRREAQHHERRRPQGQDGRDARSSATRRTSRCASGSRSRDSTRTPAAAATCRSSRRTTRRRSTRSSAATSRARGCPSRGRPASSTKAAARSSSTKPTLWPKGQYVTTQLIVTTDFLKAHKDVVQKLVNATGRGERLHQDQRRRLAGSWCRPGIQKIDGQADRRQPRDRVLPATSSSPTTRSRRRS